MISSYLVFPKLIDLRRLNVEATAQSKIGIDRVLRETRVVNANDGSPRRTGRIEHEQLLLEAQIETDAFQQVNLGPLGNSPRSRQVAVVRFCDLEEFGLIDPQTNLPILKAGDRLEAVLDPECPERALLRFPNPPGIFIDQVKPTGFGFGAGTANLVELTFVDHAPTPKPGGGV